MLSRLDLNPFHVWDEAHGCMLNDPDADLARYSSGSEICHFCPTYHDSLCLPLILEV